MGFVLDASIALSGCFADGATPATQLLLEKLVNETATRGFHDVFSLAHAEKITSYDAAYLELALRMGLPLTTKDRALRTAANKLGVTVLPTDGA